MDNGAGCRRVPIDSLGDVNGNDILDVGDYYSESEVLEFDHGDGWIWAPVLKEVHPVDLPDSAAGQAPLGSMGHYQLIKQ